MVALTTCLASAAILFMATVFTFRLPVSRIVALALVSVALYSAVLVARPSSPLVANTSVLLVALFFGSLLSTLVASLPALVSFCVAAAIVDIISSLVGITAKLSQAFQAGSNNFLQYLCLSFTVHGRLHPIIGIGDLVVLTAIYFALRRARRSGPLVFAAPVMGLLFALAVGLLVGGVAALPFIAATTVAYVLLTSRRIQDD